MMESFPKAGTDAEHLSDGENGRGQEPKGTPPPKTPSPEDTGLDEVLESLRRLQASLVPVWANFVGLLKAEWRYLKTLSIEGFRYWALRIAFHVMVLILAGITWAFFIATVWSVTATYCPVAWAPPFGVMLLHGMAAAGIKIHLNRTRL